MGIFRDIKLYAQARKWVHEYYRDMKNGRRVYNINGNNTGDTESESTEAFPRINRTHTKLGTPIEQVDKASDTIDKIEPINKESVEAFPRINRTHTKLGTPIELLNEDH